MLNNPCHLTKNKKSTKHSFVTSACNSLLLNASFIDNPGLMHGKMGISICFFHLARQSGNKIYEDYAGELIDDIHDEITVHTPVDFENGLAGIGWGIEYLVQNGYIEADTDEVLDDFDQHIFKELLYNTPQNVGLLNGLTGTGIYFLSRIKSSCQQEPTSINKPVKTNIKALLHLIDELEQQIHNITKIISEPTVAKYQSLYNQESTTGLKQFPLFDITWDYPVLIWFLSETYELNISRLKVEKLILHLTKSLKINNNLPTLHSNRLLLALSLIKLHRTKDNPVIKELLSGINRNTLLSELPADNYTIRYGTAGIAFLYRQLCNLSRDKTFKTEKEYWQLTALSSTNLDEYSPTHPFENEYQYGLLKGLAGLFI